MTIEYNLFIEPEKYLTFFQEKEHANDTTTDINLTCLVIEIFPEPKVVIYYFNLSRPKIREIVEPSLYFSELQDHNNRYDVSVTVNITRDVFDDEDSEFECRVKIPRTHYLKTIKFKESFQKQSKFFQFPYHLVLTIRF